MLHVVSRIVLALGSGLAGFTAFFASLVMGVPRVPNSGCGVPRLTVSSIVGGAIALVAFCLGLTALFELTAMAVLASALMLNP